MDILKSNQQNNLVVRETVTSFTMACVIAKEKRNTFREVLKCLCLELHPLDGPPAVIHLDPAPGFALLQTDQVLRRLNSVLEIGRVKNINKNPVAEKAILEVECELLRYAPGGGPVSNLDLAIVIARLNSRLWQSGLSSREL